MCLPLPYREWDAGQWKLLQISEHNTYSYRFIFYSWILFYSPKQKHLPFISLYVVHFKHMAPTDSHKAEGPDKGRHCPCYLPSPWSAPHLGSMIQSAMPNYGRVMGFLCWVSVSSWGDSSGERDVGGQAVTVKDISGSKRWEKRRLVLGECLAVILETGKVWCSWLDHSRMKWSSAGLFRKGARCLGC